MSCRPKSINHSEDLPITIACVSQGVTVSADHEGIKTFKLNLRLS